ncbi:MAG: FG-GAP repeat domain-containing protein [Blastocatellia bacterium]
MSTIRLSVLGLVSALLLTAPGGAPREARFRKVVLDREFRSEGVAVADINRDGRPDVIAGFVWYEAPSWKMREIGPVKPYDAAGNYSDSFVNYTADLNRDGWPDLIRIDTPGKVPVFWHENPKGKAGHWPAHRIAVNACNESPAFAPITGAGPGAKLIFSLNDEQMVWLEPDKDPAAPFRVHPISEKFGKEQAKDGGVFRYSHGMGVGDIDMDGRSDVLIIGGYWQAPRDPRTGPWKFVKASLGQECAQMRVYDVNGDGVNDVISSSAHRIGVWWREQKRGADGASSFTEHPIDGSFSQSHALELADINGDGLMDIVTGKRFWAHGPKGDINPGDPAVLLWFELKREGGQVRWIRHEIDNDSGVGTQFTVADINKDRLPDIVTSNKKGVHVFLQER